jgi:hypothetical protein
LLVDALDHVPVELELADDDGGKVDPTGAQLIERHRLRARLPELLKHPQLLSFDRRHRPDSLVHSPVLTQLSSAPGSWSPASVKPTGTVLAGSQPQNTMLLLGERQNARCGSAAHAPPCSGATQQPSARSDRGAQT